MEAVVVAPGKATPHFSGLNFDGLADNGRTVPFNPAAHSGWRSFYRKLFYSLIHST